MELERLFKITKKVLDKLSEDLNENVLIQFNTSHSNSTYMNKDKENELYYVKGWRGTICNTSVIRYCTTLYKETLMTSLEREFKFYKGEIKSFVNNNINRTIVWYDMCECKDGDLNFIRDINSLEDLKEMLEYDYHIEDYGYDINKLINSCAKKVKAQEDK